MFKRQWFIALSVLSLAAIVLVGCGLSAAAGGGPAASGSVSVLQAASPTEPAPRTVSVSGTGMASAKPDTALIDLGVESVNTDATTAIADNTTRMTAVMSALTGLGVAESDVQTTNYSMYVEQVVDKDGNPTGQTRYHVINQVRVKVRDLSKVGDLLGKTLAAGANNVNGISFNVADPTALEKDARDKAIADAKTKAEQLAAGLGAKLGPVYQVSESEGVVPPVPVYQTKAAGLGGAESVPVSAGEFNVTVQIQVTFSITQ